MRGTLAFDADVLIYASSAAHPYGQVIAAQLEGRARCLGSVLLLNEVLAKPMRAGGPDSPESRALMSVLSRVELLPYMESTARLGLVLGSAYGLRAADAVHMATAVEAGADAFVTNNAKDFPKSISEIEILYPGDL